MLMGFRLEGIKKGLHQYHADPVQAVFFWVRILVILASHLEVRLRMLADGALLGGLLAVVDVTAV